MAQYYTLEESARLLQTSQDEVKKLAEERKVRAFRDRGTLRFRAQDVEEMARALGLGSDPELQLGEVPAPKKTNSPVPKKSKPPEAEEDFEFDLTLDDSDQVEIGQEMPSSAGGSKGGKSGKSNPPRTPSKPGGPRSPAPKPGSDSDVRLVDDGSDLDFRIPVESKAAPAPSKPPSSRKKGASKLAGPDSGVRIVPLDDSSDSDIRMVPDGDDVVSLGSTRPKSASDSDIRMEDSKPPRRDSDAALVTEEIDLDAELKKSDTELPVTGSKGKAARKPPTASPRLPTSSPFELSEADLDVDKPAKPSRPARATQAKAPTDSSDDFELAPAADSSSPLELGSAEMPALTLDDSEDVDLGKLTAGGGDSGINLRDPGDSGISLEQEGSDEIEFELSLDAGATPKPSAAARPDDSDSEFELSLDDSGQAATAGDSSEFELSLDESSDEMELEPATADDSDSEFELTLDDSGGSSPLDEEGERDIFETDFEVPALEEESGSEAVALDDETDLESSDFDLALGDDDMAPEEGEESGSQVVALEDEEEEADEGAATVQRKARAAGRSRPRPQPGDLGWSDTGEEDPYAGLGPDLDDEGKVQVEFRDTPPAPWGPVPALLMIPSVLVLFVVGLMGFELIQSMNAYQKGTKPTGLIIQPLTEAIMGPLPGSKKK